MLVQVLKDGNLTKMLASESVNVRNSRTPNGEAAVHSAPTPTPMLPF